MTTPAQPPVAFITGATAGIGLALARLLAAQGYALILCGRRADRLEALRSELAAPLHLLELDVRDHAAVERAVRELPPAFADVDLLVNNAGLALGTLPAHQADLGDWQQMIDTNISALVHVTRTILPGMVARRRGHVVMMGSVAGTYPYPGGNTYGATKAFVHQFALNLRSDVQGTGVRVTCIEPGMVETEFSVVRFKGDQQKAASVYQGMKPLSAEDIAEAAWWCINRPAHVNINVVELMPVQQAFGGFAIHRG